MQKSNQRLKKFLDATKEKIIRFHKHKVEVKIIVSEKGAKLFFGGQTFSSKKKTAKLRYDSQFDYWKLWAPRSLVSDGSQKQPSGFLWSILDDDVAASATQQKKDKVPVIKLELTEEQLLGVNQKRVIFQ